MSEKSKWLFRIAILSTLASIAIHVYLTNHHYNFKYGQIVGESLCNINEKFNCDRTVSSPYSEFLGIPIAIFGGLLNFVLFGLLMCFLFPIVSSKTQKDLKMPIKALSLGIFLASLVMGGLSVFVLKTICPFCAMAYFLSFISFLCLWAALSKGYEIQSRNKSNKTTTGSLDFSFFHLKLFGGIAVFTLGFGLLFHNNGLRQYGGKELKEITKLQLQTWLDGPKKDLQLSSPLVIKPSKEAKMKVVEFADFLCPHCARASRIIHSFIKNHPDVEFSFQAFPLDGECNPVIKHTRGTPCLLARLSHCAGQQDQAWKVQSWIFENQRNLMTKEKIHKKLKENLSSLGLEEKELMTCLDSEETRRIIREQAKIAEKAGVTGTPTFYINGKKTPVITILLLEKIHSKLNP